MASVAKTMAALALCTATALSAAQAEDKWPARPIQMIVPASAGSGTDVMARAMAERLGAALKQSVIVDNRPGGSGVIGINAVVKAPNDGYTLLYTNASFAVIAPAVLRTVPYDPTKDLVPVAQTAVGGVLLLVNKDVPATNLQELIQYVKANPGKYSYGTWGNGSSGQLTMEWLKTQTGMKIDHVAYKVVPQLLTELSSGTLKVAWADPSSPLPFLRSGKIRGIAISGNTRGPQASNVLTMDEQGYKFDTVGWFGIFAPAGTNPAIIQRLTDETNKIQQSPEMAKLMANMNFEPPPVKTQAAFRDIVARDLQAWRKLANDANIKIGN